MSPGLTGNKSKSDSWTVLSLPGLALHYVHLSVPVLIIAQGALAFGMSQLDLSRSRSLWGMVLARFPLLTTNLSTASLRLWSLSTRKTSHSRSTSEPNVLYNRNVLPRRWRHKIEKLKTGGGAHATVQTPRTSDSGETETEN